MFEWSTPRCSMLIIQRLGCPSICNLNFISVVFLLTDEVLHVLLYYCEYSVLLIFCVILFYMSICASSYSGDNEWRANLMEKSTFLVSLLEMPYWSGRSLLLIDVFIPLYMWVCFSFILQNYIFVETWNLGAVGFFATLVSWSFCFTKFLPVPQNLCSWLI